MKIDISKKILAKYAPLIELIEERIEVNNDPEALIEIDSRGNVDGCDPENKFGKNNARNFLEKILESRLKIIEFADRVDFDTNHHFRFWIVKPGDFQKLLSKALEVKKSLTYNRQGQDSIHVVERVQEREPGILYKVIFNEHNREIRVDGALVGNPDLDSENDLVFGYVYKNPNRTIRLREIEDGIKQSVNKRLTDIMRDVGFKGDLRRVFFKGVTKTSLYFVNPITKEYAEKNNLPKIDLDKIGRNLEK